MESVSLLLLLFSIILHLDPNHMERDHREAGLEVMEEAGELRNNFVELNVLLFFMGTIYLPMGSHLT